MDETLSALIVLHTFFWGGGTAVLSTYAYLYLVYVREYSEVEKRRLWGPLYTFRYIQLWWLSALLSACAVCFLLAWASLHPPSPEASWVIYPYAGFFVCSALYVPLILGGMPKALVLLDLAGVAACTLALGAWALQYAAESVALQCFVGWLVLHCTLGDLLIWGYCWYRGQ
jgi:hypothetical protein